MIVLEAIDGAIASTPLGQRGRGTTPCRGSHTGAEVSLRALLNSPPGIGWNWGEGGVSLQGVGRFQWGEDGLSFP